MICDKVLLCIGQLEKIPQRESRKKKSKGQSKLKRRSGLSEQDVLSPPLCSSTEQQKKCIDFFDSRSQVKCEEYGKTYILDNSKSKKEILCLHIDKGVIDSTEIQKCDYALFSKEPNTKDQIAVFIELKGTQTKDAIKQLQSTLKLPSFLAVSASYGKVYGRIVNQSAVPNIQSTELFLDAQEMFMRKGGNLKMHSVRFEETFEKLGQL